MIDEPLTLIMPVYNEALIIEKVVREFHAAVTRCGVPVTLMIAEDGSEDGTKELLIQLQKEVPFTLVSSHQRKGYTQAFKDALSLARTPWVLFSDSDGQHDPEDIYKLLNGASGDDIISGCKMPRRDAVHRRVLSSAYNTLIGLLFGLRMKDIDSGFKLIRRSVIDRVLPQLKYMRYCVMSEFVLRAYLSGFKIREIPVRHYPRPAGETAIFRPERLPGIVWGLLRGLIKLKREYHDRISR
ncbi:MAG: glycosyltransferase family 2 protein [Candidatus Omnitrophota bacterium]|jgi:glycosyltransferase involved in cell wall biosynthesis